MFNYKRLPCIYKLNHDKLNIQKRAKKSLGNLRRKKYKKIQQHKNSTKATHKIFPPMQVSQLK